MLLPDNDIAFEKAERKGHYQRNAILMAMAFCRRWHLAVDVGAHVGFVTLDMAKFFTHIHAFEPVPDNFRCLLANVPSHVACHRVALGAERKLMGMENPCKYNSGGWEMREGQAVQMKTLDSYDLQNVGLIKIDVQGYEQEVLKGAKETLAKWRPVLLLENVEHVEGYHIVTHIRNDTVFIPDAIS